MDSCFFDATEVAPLEASFAPIPEGDYEVMIVDSKTEPNKAGTGSFLKLQIQVVSGPHAKYTLWVRLNLRNPSVKAVEMAKRELSSICHAVGVLRPATKEALHNIPMIAHVLLVDDDRNPGQKKNEIKGWKAKSEGSAVVETPTPQAAPESSSTTGAGEKPW